MALFGLSCISLFVVLKQLLHTVKVVMNIIFVIPHVLKPTVHYLNIYFSPLLKENSVKIAAI